MSEIDLSQEHFKFFQHKECEFFPCHKINDPDLFNCLFCYCPLYALGTRCGGNYKILEGGYKDCSGCVFPHVKGNYEKINAQFKDIVEVARQQTLEEDAEEGQPQETQAEE